METKKLKFQTVAAGNQGTVDATIVEGENKENNAAKTACNLFKMKFMRP